jgi:hypothetical protein
MRACASLSILILMWQVVRAQRDVPIRQRLIHFSIAPGLGTNGTQPGSYENFFSLNLTSGYAASNLLLGISTVSSLNTNHTRGLQFAGLCNLTGANAFAGLTKKEKEEKITSGFSSYLNGVQTSGVTNIVLGDVYGAQFTGGLNLAKGHMLGVQVAGFSNIVYKFSFGVQIAGFFNVSMVSMSGTQISGLSNFTRGELSGLQLALLNQAGDIQGINTYEQTQPTGFQIGLVNRARKMDGFQVGLVNFAERSQGTQIGLVNFFKGGTAVGTKDGTALGLLNFGGSGYFAAYADETFALNYDISTGTFKNARFQQDKLNVYITNSIIYSHAALRSDAWGVGYGLRRMYFNKSELPGMTESRFFAFGLDFEHINLESGEFTRDLSLLTRFKLMIGKRIAPKLFGINWYASISANAYAGDGGELLAPERFSRETAYRDVAITMWPGISAGILLH